MKFALFIAIFLSSTAFAQQNAAPQTSTPPATTPPVTSGGMGASLNKALGMFVYPAKNQTPATQEADSAFCYDWGKQQSGVDPLNPPKVEAAATPTGRDGSAVRGAAKGAAAGAAIGAVSGDAGKGAAIGATAGGMGGAAGRRQKQQAQAQQAQQNAKGQEAALIDSFKKAYAACLTGKGYTVN